MRAGALFLLRLLPVLEVVSLSCGAPRVESMHHGHRCSSARLRLTYGGTHRHERTDHGMLGGRSAARAVRMCSCKTPATHVPDATTG